MRASCTVCNFQIWRTFCPITSHAPCNGSHKLNRQVFLVVALCSAWAFLALSLSLCNSATLQREQQLSRRAALLLSLSASLSASAVRGSSPLTRTLILSSHICHALLQRTHTHAGTTTADALSHSLSLTHSQ